MPFSPAFEVSQSVATPEDLVIEDTSSGSDAAITSRRIYVTDSEGEYVVPSGTATDYISWALASNPVTISDLLTTDISCTILVQWLNVSGTVLYSTSDEFCLRGFSKQSFVSLIQAQAQTPGIVQDTNYYNNLCAFWINIVGANTMIEDAADLAGSQNCLNRATDYRLNETKYF